MLQRMFRVGLVMLLLVALPASLSFGAGRGRGRSAPRGGSQGLSGQNNGAARNGQFNRGQQNGGNFNQLNRGGLNQQNQGGFQRSAAGNGNFRNGQAAGNFGAAPDRNQLNGFLGLPQNQGNATGAQGAAAAGAYSNRNAAQFSGTEGAAAGAAHANNNAPEFSGAQGAAAGTAYSNRNAPQFSGAEGAAAGAAHVNNNSPQFSGAQGAAAGAAYSNRNAPQFSGAQGAAVGYAAGNNAGYATGFGPVAPNARTASAAAVRGDFHNYDLYGANWYTAHPAAWRPATWPAGAWAAATWNTVGTWFGRTYVPVYYDYGATVVYEDDSVYVNGESAGTSTEYYEQANTLAENGAAADAPTDGEWMSLGVFAMKPADSSSATFVVQLAINKQGVVRGNSSDTSTGQSQPVQGAVDLQTQRVAFTIGDNSASVFETGLYNLTKDEAPALLHNGSESSEQWLLVRLQQPAQ